MLVLVLVLIWSVNYHTCDSSLTSFTWLIPEPCSVGYNTARLIRYWSCSLVIFANFSKNMAGKCVNELLIFHENHDSNDKKYSYLFINFEFGISVYLLLVCCYDIISIHGFLILQYQLCYIIILYYIVLCCIVLYYIFRLSYIKTNVPWCIV